MKPSESEDERESGDLGEASRGSVVGGRKGRLENVSREESWRSMMLFVGKKWWCSIVSKAW